MARESSPRRPRIGRIALTAGALVAALVFAQPRSSPVMGPAVALGLSELRQPVTTRPDDTASKAAFLEVYKVLLHPRCMNCHPKGDSPLQGEDSRPHAQSVKRGPDGRGKYAAKCSNCHQAANLPGENMPPGNPTWRLPSPKTPLVFEGLSPGELCRQLKDPSRNGGKTLEGLLHHVAEDRLVLWGWAPGDGRSKPPLAHADFVAKMREWVDHGAECPE